MEDLGIKGKWSIEIGKLIVYIGQIDIITYKYFDVFSIGMDKKGFCRKDLSKRICIIIQNIDTSNLPETQKNILINRFREVKELEKTRNVISKYPFALKLFTDSGQYNELCEIKLQSNCISDYKDMTFDDLQSASNKAGNLVKCLLYHLTIALLCK